MHNNITPFAFEDQLVRTVTDERGEPWFVAKDLCRVLDIVDHHQVLDSLDGDEVGRCTIPTSFGDKEVKTISESGMYSLVFRSRKPEAKRFSKWVRAEVLPSLRRTGTYTMPTAQPQIIEPIPPKPIEPASERLPREMPDMELPESALNLRPSMRMRLWQDALQSARLEGAGIAYAVDCFVKLCTVMAKQPKPKESPFREEVKQFIVARCRSTPEQTCVAAICTSHFVDGAESTARDICRHKEFLVKQWGCIIKNISPMDSGIVM